jgi:hypothetical protein
MYQSLNYELNHATRIPEICLSQILRRMIAKSALGTTQESDLDAD